MFKPPQNLAEALILILLNIQLLIIVGSLANPTLFITDVYKPPFRVLLISLLTIMYILTGILILSGSNTSYYAALISSLIVVVLSLFTLIVD